MPNGPISDYQTLNALNAHMYTKRYMNIWWFGINVVSLQPKNKSYLIMTALTFSDFRKNMASSFDLVDAGEHVFINRGSKKMYAIIAVDDDDLTITPAMAAKIEKARKEYKEGKGVSLKTHEDIDKYFESL